MNNESICYTDIGAKKTGDHTKIFRIYEIIKV